MKTLEKIVKGTTSLASAGWLTLLGGGATTGSGVYVTYLMDEKGDVVLAASAGVILTLIGVMGTCVGYHGLRHMTKRPKYDGNGGNNGGRSY